MTGLHSILISREVFKYVYITPKYVVVQRAIQYCQCILLLNTIDNRVTAFRVGCQLIFAIVFFFFGRRREQCCTKILTNLVHYVIRQLTGSGLSNCPSSLSKSQGGLLKFIYCLTLKVLNYQDIVHRYQRSQPIANREPHWQERNLLSKNVRVVLFSL